MLKCKYPFPADWEQKLQEILLSRGDRENKVYICSPLRGADWKEIQRNMQAARFYMYFTWLHMHRYARAPHAFLPLLYCDDIPQERGKAITSGMYMVSESTALFVCGNRITEGMRNEIEHAMNFKRPITVFHPDLYKEMEMMLRKKRGDPKLLKLNTDPRHATLGFGTEELFEEVPDDA